MYKKRSLWTPAFLAIFFIFLIAAPAPAAEEQAVEKPVALVNGVVISWETLEGEAAKMMEMSAMQGDPLDEARVKDIKRDLLERLINYELLWQESVKKGVVVSDQAVTDELQRLKNQFPDESSFKQVVEGMGITEAQLRSSIRKNIAVRRLIEEEVVNKIEVASDQSESFYKNHSEFFEEPEQVKASHIYIGLKEDASEEESRKAEAAIEDVQKRLNEGEDFGELARETSQCPSSEHGGDLGFFSRGNMDKAFEEAAFSLETRETSPIVKSSFGYHIIKVTDRKEARVIPYDEAKENIDNYLRGEKANEKVEEYVNELREKADIKRYL